MNLNHVGLDSRLPRDATVKQDERRPGLERSPGGRSGREAGRPQ